MSNISESKWDDYFEEQLENVTEFICGLIFSVSLLAIIVILLPGIYPAIVGILLIVIYFFTMVSNSRITRMQYDQLVVGLVSNTSQPTTTTNAAALLGLNRIEFSRSLVRLIERNILKIELYPEFDAFGPPGLKPKKSLIEIRESSEPIWHRYH